MAMTDTMTSILPFTNRKISLSALVLDPQRPAKRISNEARREKADAARREYIKKNMNQARMWM